jgi:cytochrome P450
MEKDTYQPSYTSKLIHALKNEGKAAKEEMIEAIKWTAAVIFAGGSDTTVSTLTAFILAMVLNPDVQQKAQEEIDRVIGSDRLPAADDQEHLPYINAVIKESLRYFPVAPMGNTHQTEEEIFFRGYRIPKGSYILPCTWWYLNDPKIYPEPSKFAPERYMEPRNEPDPVDAFGHGRRVCPGKFIAQESLFITISRTLAAFTIGKAVYEGKPIDVECKHIPGLIDHPVPFPYSIVPRNEKYAEIIRSVEVEHPWEGSSGEAVQGNEIFDRLKEDCKRSVK